MCKHGQQHDASIQDSEAAGASAHSDEGESRVLGEDGHLVSVCMCFAYFGLLVSYL